MDCSLQSFSVHGIFQARVLEWVATLAFLYTNNEKSEREIKESIPFTIATKTIKYLGINLKETNELYTENYKTLRKEIKDDINREIFHVSE